MLQAAHDRFQNEHNDVLDRVSRGGDYLNYVLIGSKETTIKAKEKDTAKKAKETTTKVVHGTLHGTTKEDHHKKDKEEEKGKEESPLLLSVISAKSLDTLQPTVGTRMLRIRQQLLVQVLLVRPSTTTSTILLLTNLLP